MTLISHAETTAKDGLRNSEGCSDRPPTDSHRVAPFTSAPTKSVAGLGATLTDVGWMATFNDPPAWDHEGAVPEGMPRAAELVAAYEAAWGAPLPSLGWFRAFAAYKFAIITGFNLGLHRRGKRHDPLWERIGRSVPSLQERALQLLTG